jgi:hypothetical protein
MKSINRRIRQPDIAWLVGIRTGREHLRQRVDVKPIFGRAIPQGSGDGNGQLLEQGVQNREARHDLGRRWIAAVHFAHRLLVHRLPQIDLKNFGIS